MSYKKAKQEFLDLCDELMRPKLPKPPPKPKVEAVVLPWPKPMSPEARQAIIDATWERVQAERRAAERDAERCFHRSPGDSDWGLR